MQKGFKLLQTDSEGAEKLQEATMGLPKTPILILRGKGHTGCQIFRGMLLLEKTFSCSFYPAQGWVKVIPPG